MGIPGNESADKLAVSSLLINQITAQIPLSNHEFKRVIKHHFHESWGIDWSKLHLRLGSPKFEIDEPHYTELSSRDAPIVSVSVVSTFFSGIGIGLSNFVVFWPIPPILLYFLLVKANMNLGNLAV